MLYGHKQYTKPCKLCLALPKPKGGAYSFPPFTPSATTQKPLDGPCLICLKKLTGAAQLSLTQKPRCLDFLDYTHRDKSGKRTKSKSRKQKSDECQMPSKGVARH